MSEGNVVGKAIHESNSNVALARAETRKRKFWGYIQIDILQEWAKTQAWENNVIPNEEDLVRRFFGTRLDAPVHRGKYPNTEAELLAVWRRVDLPTEYDQPNFNNEEPV